MDASQALFPNTCIKQRACNRCSHASMNAHASASARMRQSQSRRSERQHKVQQYKSATVPPTCPCQGRRLSATPSNTYNWHPWGRGEGRAPCCRCSCSSGGSNQDCRKTRRSWSVHLPSLSLSRRCGNAPLLRAWFHVSDPRTNALRTLQCTGFVA